MSKKKRSDASTEVGASTRRERIGILLKQHMQCKNYGPHTGVRNIKGWARGQIIWDEKDLDDLLEDGAMIEVYYRDVDGSAED